MPGGGTEMAGGGITDRMWGRITRTLIDTGRPPHSPGRARPPAGGPGALPGREPRREPDDPSRRPAGVPDRLAASRDGLHRLVSAPERPAHPVPGDGARGAEVVRPVRLRGDVGDLALPGRTCADRRGLSRLRHPPETRYARPPPYPSHAADRPWSPELRLWPVSR